MTIAMILTAIVAFFGFYWVFRLLFFFIAVIINAVKTDDMSEQQSDEMSKSKLKLPVDLEINYEDYEGSYTEREITVNSIERRGGSIYLKAFCHLRNDLRTFNLNRVIGKAINTKTGELLDIKKILSS